MHEGMRMYNFHCCCARGKSEENSKWKRAEWDGAERERAHKGARESFVLCNIALGGREKRILFTIQSNVIH